MYVYIQSEPWLWTVGHYDPSGHWHPESDHSKSDEAARRVAWLNGAKSSATTLRPTNPPVAQERNR